MTTFLRFTDHEGDPLAITNEVSAVYLTQEKEAVAAFPGQDLLTKVSEQYTVIHHRTGNYRVRDSFEAVMAKIEMTDELERLALEGNRD